MRIGNTRAHTMLDMVTPPVLGRQLVRLAPATPDGEVRVLHDAGEGMIGPPSVSYDGSTIYFSMKPAGEPFFQVYRISADGTALA